jgi:hypothetical protein
LRLNKYARPVAGHRMLQEVGEIDPVALDVYDAITSNRPYKQGWCPADSLRRMAAWRGGHLDAQLFAAFVKCLGIYPLGTLVRLQSERLAAPGCQERIVSTEGAAQWRLQDIDRYWAGEPAVA